MPGQENSSASGLKIVKMEPSPVYEPQRVSVELCASPIVPAEPLLESRSPPIEAHMLLQDVTTPVEEISVSPLERTPIDETIYVGQRYPNRKGKPNILIFHLPNGKCYSFSYKQSKTDFDQYVCNECRKIKGASFRYKVNADVFITNPHSNHLCSPLDAEKEVGSRMRNQASRRLSGTETLNKKTQATPSSSKKSGSGRGGGRRGRKPIKKSECEDNLGATVKENARNRGAKKKSHYWSRRPCQSRRKSTRLRDTCLDTDKENAELPIDHTPVVTSDSTLPQFPSIGHVQKNERRSDSVEIINIINRDEVDKCSIRGNSSLEVHQFLESIGMDHYKGSFTGFTLHGLGILTPDELISMGLEKTHAYCIYSTLKARRERANREPSKQIETSGELNIYVAELTHFGGDLVYKMIHLPRKTKDELYAALKNCNAIRRSERTRMFYVGPAGIKVQMSDEVVSMWKNESVYAISCVNGGAYHIQSMSR